MCLARRPNVFQNNQLLANRIACPKTEIGHANVYLKSSLVACLLASKEGKQPRRICLALAYSLSGITTKVEV